MSRNQLYKARRKNAETIELHLLGGSCCQCGSKHNDADDSPVTWRCVACHGFCCRKCTLVNPLSKTYYSETYCSVDCRDAHLVQSAMLGASVEDD